MRSLATAHGELRLPAFFPDATRGVVRTIGAEDLEACGVQGVMVNVLHLGSKPGGQLVASVGGIHAFMGWRGPIASDSGGFQAYSLATGRPKLGQVTPDGFVYRLAKGQGKKTLTPERCIQQQFRLGTDILFCLDHCTHPSAPDHEQRESVEHTVAWAERCKAEFGRCVEKQGAGRPRPLLFAVVQGGADAALRRTCAERLLDIGFDGFGFGGWPIGDDGQLVDAVGMVAKLVPEHFPKHALGIGKPENVIAAHRLGYDLFDCVIPTRDARHQRLYVFTASDTADSHACVYIQDERYARDERPVEEGCDCLCCRRYSRAYLHHVFRINDPLASRLATIHNLRFYARLIARLRACDE